MANLPAELARRIELLASDRESGASAILDETLKILGAARADGVPIRAVARAVCRAQPSMASVWNAALEAIADEHAPGRFDRFTQRVTRAPEALGRFASDALAAAEGAGPLRLVTVSMSRSVAVVFDAVRRQRPIRVCCSESRPALE